MPDIQPSGWTVRQDVIEAIGRYVSDGLAPGDFVRAVLANDLAGAVHRADAENIHALRGIIYHVQNEIPAGRHGTHRIVEAWIFYNSAMRQTKELVHQDSLEDRQRLEARALEVYLNAVKEAGR